MDMSKRYSERFKMQVAYDYFVDRCPVNALGDKYKITGDTVRYFCSERRGEYRDAIVRKEDTAKKLLEIFYYYYRNYEKAVAPLRKEQEQ